MNLICMLCYFNDIAYSLIVTTTNVPFWFLVVCSSGVEGGRVGEMVGVLIYLYHWFILNSIMLG
jgi:hypothetical protein